MKSAVINLGIMAESKEKPQIKILVKNILFISHEINL